MQPRDPLADERPSRLRDAPRIVRVQLLFVIASILLIRVVDLVVSFVMGTGTILFVSVLMLAFALWICWGVYRGKHWARWWLVLGFMVTLLLQWRLVVLPFTADTVAPVPVLIGAILATIWVGGLSVLLFGPGVGAFFHRESRRAAAQDDFLQTLAGELGPEPVDFDRLPEHQRVFRSVMDFRSVAETSLEDYYRSDAGDTAHAVVGALRAVGADELAELMAEANGLFPGSAPPRSAVPRQEALRKLSWHGRTKLSSLENQMSGGLDELTELLHAYVRRYLAPVRTPSVPDGPSGRESDG